MKLRCLYLTPILLLLPFGQAKGETAEADDHFANQERITRIIRRWEENGRSAATARLNADNSENAKKRRKLALELLETAAAYVDAGMLSGDGDRKASFTAARQILDPLLAAIPETLEVTSEGGANLDNLRLSEAAWAHALRYRIAGEPADLQRASQLLLEFADKMQAWPVLLHNAGNRWVPQTTRRLEKSYSSGGFWGRWHPLDMMECYPLLRTYRVVAPTLSAEERKRIIEGVFDLQVALVDRWEEGFHNTTVYKIDGLIHFGFALDRPDYIHRAIGLLRNLSSKGFSPDGFWHEGTPAYHQQVNLRLQSSVRLLDGYSDRAGTAARASAQRFDPLQLQKEFAFHRERTAAAWRKLTLPNGSIAAVNDADPDTYYGEPKSASTPELLGTSGFAILGSGERDEQQQLFLNFKGTYGHEHLDVNGIHWFALGRRWFDETRYRPLSGSGSSRKWSSSTAAHNTVVIDEKSQDNRFARGRSSPASGDAMASHYATNHLGDLLLFDGRQGAVQVVEVEGKKAYPTVAQRYRRTLVKVDLGKGEGYVVDIFRVQGGTVHDYMLHGALADPYTVSASTPLQPTTGQLHQYIDLTGKGAPELPFEWTFSYEDGASSRSMVLSPAATTLLLGEAPAINRLGKAPFVDLRHEATESTFVVIHEARKGAPRIDHARLLTAPGQSNVAVEIRIGDRVDTILSTLSPETELAISPSRPNAGEIRMDGRLGYVRCEADQVKDAILWDGTHLSLAGKILCRSPHASYEAQVSETKSREAGDPMNAVIFDKLLPEESLSGATLHIDLGGELTWSYRIAHVEHAGGRTIVHLDHDPGFIVKEKALELTFHPSWSISGAARARIPVVSHRTPEKQ